MQKLRQSGLEEFLPSGLIVEQLCDFNASSPDRRSFGNSPDRSPHHFQLGSYFGGLSRGHQPNMGDSGNARQCFTPKTHRSDGPEIQIGSELTRGMPLKSAWSISLTHAFPVVAHPNQGEPSVLHLDRDGPTPRIETVLEKLFDDRRRALDHLSRCNAADDLLRENTDLATAVGFQHGTMLPMSDKMVGGRGVASRRRSSDFSQLILCQL